MMNILKNTQYLICFLNVVNKKDIEECFNSMKITFSVKQENL